MESQETDRWGKLGFAWGKRTYVMGIINVTPDSFSGDGLGYDAEAALEQALRFQDEGADIIDVGGESTRPGSTPVTVEEEKAARYPCDTPAGIAAGCSGECGHL